MASSFDAVRRLTTATARLLLSRAEFATLELAEARARFMRWIVLALTGAVLALLTLISLSSLLVLALWPRFGWGTLAALAAVYGIGALWAFRSLAVEQATAPPVLSETLRELSLDRDALFAARPQRDDGSEP